MKEAKSMILAAGFYGILLNEPITTKDLYEAAALLKILIILKPPACSVCFLKVCCRTKWQKKRLEQKIKKSTVWFRKIKSGKTPVFAVYGSALLLFQETKNLEESTIEEVMRYFGKQ